MNIAKVARIAVCGLIVMAGLVFTACGGSPKPDSSAVPTVTPAVVPIVPSIKTESNLAIDPLRISGTSSQERMDSLVFLLNENIGGFARMAWHDREIITGEKTEDSFVLYRYVLLVYANIEWTEKTLEGEEKTEVKSETYLNNVQTIVKQVLGYTTKFVADAQEKSVVETYVVFPDLDIRVYPLDGKAFMGLRDAPLESWSGFASEVQIIPVPFDYLEQLTYFAQAFLAQQQGQEGKE